MLSSSFFKGYSKNLLLTSIAERRCFGCITLLLLSAVMETMYILLLVGCVIYLFARFEDLAVCFSFCITLSYINLMPPARFIQASNYSTGSWLQSVTISGF